VSHSPLQDTSHPPDAYVNAWKRLALMIREGRSLSGRERNCCFLNLRGTQFADVSAVFSLDHVDDSRAVALTDWDHDGDLDVWLTNRTGPQVRFLRNDVPTENQFLAVRLEGDPQQGCNRDAIGARVELHMSSGEPRRLVRTLSAGDGFLSQSSKWIIFGLGNRSDIQHLTIRWPGTATMESYGDLVAGKRYRIVQGSNQAVSVASRQTSVELSPRDLDLTPSSDRSRAVLSKPLKVGQLDYVEHTGQTKTLHGTPNSPVLINLWSATCDPCIEELKDFVKQSNQVFAAQLTVLALNVDGLESSMANTNDHAKQVLAKLGFPFASGLATKELVQKLDDLQHKFIYRQRQLPLPSSFLIDDQGRLAVVYKGRVDVEQLVADSKHIGRASERERNVIAGRPGSWVEDHFVKFPIAVANEYLEGGYIEEAQAHLEKHLEKESRFQDAATSEEARRQDIRIADIHHALAGIAYGRRNVKATLHHYEQALKHRPKYLPVENNLAWLLATLPDDSLRDGDRALQLAQSVCRRTDYQHTSFLDTLAAAHAEAGQFEDAVKTTQKAIELAEHKGNQLAVKELRQRLQLYQEKKPFRQASR